jgi:hypothetical protein
MRPMNTKTQTLINTVESMTFAICKLIDANAPAEKIAAARAERDAVLAAIRSRPNGRNYDRGYT